MSTSQVNRRVASGFERSIAGTPKTIMTAKRRAAQMTEGERAREAVVRGRSAGELTA